MAKRYEPLKEFGRSTKKPKLDITINRGRPTQATTSTYNSNNQNNRYPPLATGATTSGQQQRYKPPSPAKNICENFWDDDDDDVILMATQVAEIQVAAAYKESQPQLRESEITFSEFAPNVPATTSTQRMQDVPAQNLLADMFDDDDDDFLLCGVAAEQQLQLEAKADPFKKPEPPALTQTVAAAVVSTRSESKSLFNSSATVQRPAASQAASAELPCSQSAARRQLASERQIKFLMERVDTLKKENSKLTTELSDNKSQMETKQGEATMLRDELRHMKQQVESMRMEKMCSTQAAKTEWQSKIATLSKEVEAKQTELQLKNVECSVLKMRHADETQRLQQTMRNESLLLQPEAPAPTTSSTKKSNTRQTQRALIALRTLSLHGDDGSYMRNLAARSHAQQQLSPDAFEHAHERGTAKQRRTLFQLELATMQTILAQLQLGNAHTTLQLQQLAQRTVASVCKVLPEFWTYVHSLEFLKNCRIHRYHAYDLLQDESDAQRRSIHQPTELHADERALSLRRYIAGLNIVCRMRPEIARLLIDYQHGEYMLLQIAIDALNKLSYSREICEHFALLEAFALLLQSLLLSQQPATATNAKSAELLVALMKSLIFCRPSPWVFAQLSRCLLQCRQLPLALNLLCVNSDAHTFLSDPLQSIYCFAADSCVLQVYAGLLEIAFPLYSAVRRRHFALLSVICEQHVRFVQHCFEQPPKFIHEQLPSYDDDDEEDEDEAEVADQDDVVVDLDATSRISVQPMNVDSVTNGTCSSSATTNELSALTAARGGGGGTHCECYTKLCLSLVTLLFQLLRQWELTERTCETTKVELISKIAVKLLHTIFCDNYTTRLFRDAEDTTKHYLQLICKWWTENAKLLNFNEIHNNFLQKLKTSHIMPKQLSAEQNMLIIGVDQKEWQRITNNQRSFKTTETPVTITNADGVQMAQRLKLMHDAVATDVFFEGLKGYAFNFQ